MSWDYRKSLFIVFYSKQYNIDNKSYSLLLVRKESSSQDGYQVYRKLEEIPA